MKKSIIILAVSAFYLISCGDSTDEHSHSDGEGHSHDENGDHHDHDGHNHDGHDHDHDNAQEDFVVDSLPEEEEGPSDSRHPMDSEIETYCHVHGKYHDNSKIHKEGENDPDVHDHDHDGYDHDHDHDHDDNK